MSIQYPWALLLLAVIPAVLYLQNKTTAKTGFSRVAVLGNDLEPGPVKKYASGRAGSAGHGAHRFCHSQYPVLQLLAKDVS